ncbi:hypothetical protein [Candidatus Nucleicultrix amoebiphila]|jgi:hypothetical protein|uniref:Uncharacterized protein n=1 Tax=Candidatus Nucleicultrix amoebiphila FS5 TaxID=1414854 RepID=A0A1W6N3J9_9PROT|nr:hypothetical protein [Candidatus Nucleicultrix amoebiphila]ARN84338.1 hypothetical protein GQ61_02210 [Candidatus Nucleicultrix amoebiphila FS5]
MRNLFLVSVAALALVGCSQTSDKISLEKSQMQIREFQTRSYDTADAKAVMKTVLDVLQDDGYIVKNAVPDLGLLTATKEDDLEESGEAFWKTFWMGHHATWKKHAIIEASCNVSSHNNQSKVRANFVVKVMDNKGGTVEVKQIDDQAFYQKFFSKVDKGIFLNKEKL